MEGEMVYRPYATSIELSRTSKGLYSWTVKCRGDNDEEVLKRIYDMNASMESYGNANSEANNAE